MRKATFHSAFWEIIMNQNVRKITKGAMMVALIGVFMLIDRQFQGTFSSMFVFLLPLPMVYFGAKYGLRDSLMVLAAIIFVAFIFASPFAVFFFVAEAIIGLVYGCGIYQNVESKRLLLRTMVLGGLTELLAVVINVAIFGVSFDQLVLELRQTFDMMQKSMGLTVNTNVDINVLLRNVFFVSTLMLGVLEAIVTHISSRLLLKRLRMKVPESTPLYLYFPPKWIGYVALVGMFGYLYVGSGYIKTEPALTIVSALGTFAYFYLTAMGVVGLLVMIGLMAKESRKILTFVVFILAIVLSFPVAIYGFLYITTNMHQRIVEEGYHATKNESN